MSDTRLPLHETALPPLDAEAVLWGLRETLNDFMLEAHAAITELDRG